MRRIGILTYHRPINDGAVLQACAVLRSLATLFPEDHVEIIDYRSWTMERQALCKAARSTGELWAKVKKFLHVRRFVRNELVLSRDHLLSNSYRRACDFVADRYDVLVTGSDVVWEICDAPAGPTFPNIYWLDQSFQCKKIAFAVSANRTALNELRQDQWKKIEQLASSFSLIGVRDQTTMDLLQRVGLSEGSKVMRVPDPTFVLQPPRLDLDEKLQRHGRRTDQPLVGIAIYDRGIRRAFVKSWKERGFQVACIVGYDSLADINLHGSFSPFEWTNVFRYLDFCITEYMHPAIFCLKNRTPVLCLDLAECYANTESKTCSLFRDVKMKESYLDFDAIGRDIGLANAAAREVMANWDSERVEQTVQEMAGRVREFLHCVSECVRKEDTSCNPRT